MGSKMAWGKAVRLLAMLLLFLVVASVPFGYSDSASAPFVDIGSYGNARWEPVTVPGLGSAGTSSDGTDAPGDDSPPTTTPDDTDDHDDEALPPPEESPSPDSSAAPVLDDYIKLQMSESDFFKGFLLLVNPENAYEIDDNAELVYIADVNTGSYRVEYADILLSASIIEPLNAMMDAYYLETGRDNVTVISGYRSYARQQNILNDYIKQMGEAEGRRWAASPGYSEHHTGLAVDFGVFNGSAVKTFTGLGSTEWFGENSYKYGFILRFPGSKTKITGTADEPWHFRYIGTPHAKLVYDNGWCLEEYIEFIMSYTYDEPYTTIYNGDTYDIYYTSDTELHIPFDCEFDLSGNNIDGLIVTIKYE